MVETSPSPWNLKSWFWASRPFSLQASIAPVLVGTALAATVADPAWAIFGLVLVGSVLVQVATNLTDEYSDHHRTGSAGKFLAPHKVIERGLLTERAVLMGLLITFGVSIAIGLYITSQVGWPILAMCIAALLVAYLYSGGPYPLGNSGLSEALVFLFMGPVMVMGAYYVQLQQLTWTGLFVSLPMGFLVASILHCNNLRDVEEDRKEGKLSIARLIGPTAGRWFYVILVGLAYASVVAMAASDTTHTLVLAALVTVPLAARNVRRLWLAVERPAMNRVLINASNLHGLTGLALAAGLTLSKFL
jgi:1,4-dihydroxy-2-naphthoate octaprenyltransferase